MLYSDDLKDEDPYEYIKPSDYIRFTAAAATLSSMESTDNPADVTATAPHRYFQA